MRSIENSSFGYGIAGDGADSGPRRYVGKSKSRQAQGRGMHAPVSPPSVRPQYPRPTRQPQQPSQTQGPGRSRSRKRDAADEVSWGVSAMRLWVAPWSLRLMLAVSLIMGVGVAWRLSGLFVPPLDAPLGVEATHAAFANLAGGQVGGALDAVRLWPPPAPWYGPAPANPGAGLPLYGWLTALGTGVLGGGELLGRALSVLFSMAAGLALFALVRRTAGARAALYSILLYTIAPFSVIMGQRFSPASLLLATQALALLAFAKWRSTVQPDAPGGSALAFALAVGAGALAALVDPGGIFLIAPAAYLTLASLTNQAADSPQWTAGKRNSALSTGSPSSALAEAWQRSPNRGKLVGYASALFGSAFLWWLFAQGSLSGIQLGVGDGGGGVPVGVAALLNIGTYVGVIGLSVERVLTLVGVLLLIAGLLRGARPPITLLFHAWLVGGLLHVLADASRVGRHEDVLLPLLLPLCALVGVGAAWAGSLPARVWLAVTEQKREDDSDYAVSPHTAWLLDLPEERAVPENSARPQAQIALGKSIAQRTQKAGEKLRRAWYMGVGHVAVIGCFALIAVPSWGTTHARLQTGTAALELEATGREVAALTPSDARLIIGGPFAPELFFAGRRTGWTMPAESFSIVEVQALQREGATYLLSADQEWLGRHPDYPGLLAEYSVKKLSRNYILFDLNTRPAANDRLYFLESGHTLGGEFRRFWEANGGVLKLGYPISEELDEPSPLDGQVRATQYFERAVLEYHPEFAGTPDSVMIAAVGRWVTIGRELPRVAPFVSTPDRWYFADTGHSVKEAFLRYWQREGGVKSLGYPISEEVPEISPADGKVYTVQYFERARLEWHPTGAGTPDEVQLGLIGKQAYELRK